MRRSHCLVLLLIAVSCRHATPGSATEGYVTSGYSTLWPSATIPVCWENAADANPDLLAAAQDAVVTAYGTPPLQFAFTGWGDCQPAAAGVHVRVADQTSQVKAYGVYLNALTDGVVLNFTFATAGLPACQTPALLPACVRSYAIHEFGHVLGLRHEANRPDNTCPAQDQMGGLGEAGAFPVGPYDPDSIMNYCKLLADLSAGTPATLSSEDAQTLQQYYAHQLSFPAADLGAACSTDTGSWDSVNNCCTVASATWPNGATLVSYRACARPSAALQAAACALAQGQWQAAGSCCQAAQPHGHLLRWSSFYIQCLPAAAP